MAQNQAGEKSDEAQKIAARLRKIRNDHFLNQTDLAAKMGYSRGTVTRYESGKHVPPPDYIMRVEAALGSVETDDNQRLRQYVTMEQTEAQRLQQWQPQVVPALLQTEAYMREVMANSIPPRAPGDIDKFVASQVQRQDALWRDKPVYAEFVLSEMAVTWLVGGLEVMREQWNQLIEWSTSNSAITVQVLPRTIGAHPSMQGSYTILELAEAAVLYLETSARGEVITRSQTVDEGKARFRNLMANALNPRESVAFFQEQISEAAA